MADLRQSRCFLARTRGSRRFRRYDPLDLTFWPIPFLSAYSVYAVRTKALVGRIRLRVLFLESGILVRELWQLFLLWRRMAVCTRKILRDKRLLEGCGGVPFSISQRVPCFLLPYLVPLLGWGWKYRVFFYWIFRVILTGMLGVLWCFGEIRQYLVKGFDVFFFI